MSEEETETIPYVIMVISLDNTYNLFGSSEKRNLTVNIADQIVELICNRIYKNNENYIVIVILHNYNLKKSLFLLYGNFRKQFRGKKGQKGGIGILLRKV